MNFETKGNSAGEMLAGSIFEFFILIFSVWTVLAHGFMLSGFSFNSLIYSYSIIVLPISYFYIKRRRLFSTSPYAATDYRVIAIISFLVFSGALLSLLSIRPDADDANYLSRAVYYFEHPAKPLDFEFHNHATAGFDFRSLLLTFPVVELFWSYFAVIFGVHPLDIYHFAVPALGGALIPMAWYLLISKFTDDERAAALGACRNIRLQKAILEETEIRPGFNVHFFKQLLPYDEANCA